MEAQLARNARTSIASRSARLAVNLLLAMTALVGATQGYAVDEDAAQDLAKASGCFKCHGIDKKKDGPALRDAAAKFKVLPDAVDKLIYHITTRRNREIWCSGSCRSRAAPSTEAVKRECV